MLRAAFNSSAALNSSIGSCKTMSSIRMLPKPATSVNSFKPRLTTSFKHLSWRALSYRHSPAISQKRNIRTPVVDRERDAALVTCTRFG